MKSTTKFQVGIVVGAIVLFVLLFFANKTKQVGPEQANSVSIKKQGAALQAFLDAKLALMSDSLKKQHDSFQTLIAKGNAAYLDSMVVFWDRQRHPDGASFFTEKLAEKKKTAEAWFLAGERYYYAIRFVKDQKEVPILYEHAIFSFENGLKLSPNDIEGKIKLASCIVEGTQEPMKGIKMLQEVEKTDSNNVNLQLSFASFSARSGQWDKAVKRFEKVIQLKPDYLEAYLYLADAYQNSGDKNKAIKCLEGYIKKVPDESAKQEVKTYIENLKKSN